MSNFSIRIDLLKLTNSFAVNFKGKTATKKCIVIPIEDNEIFIGEKGMYLQLQAIEVRERKYDDTHIVKRSINKETYSAMSEEDKKTTPIIGQMRPMQAPPMVVSQTIDGAETEAADDLPF